MKAHKMDRYLVSKQQWELDYIVNKICKEASDPFACSKSDVLNAIKSVGRSRRKVYAFLRN